MATTTHNMPSGMNEPGLPRFNRRKIECAIDNLIALLDALDVDTDDREDDGTCEPSLGAPERGLWYSQASWATGSLEDGEGEPESGYDLPEGDDERCASGDVDKEPLLGAPENHDTKPNQELWAQGGHQGCTEPEADELDPKKPGPSRSWEAVEADRRVADAVARQAMTMRRQKQGLPPRSPHANVGNLRLLGPGRLRLGGAHV